MSPSEQFRISAIRPSLLRNGNIDRIKSTDATCATCSAESKMEDGFGLNKTAEGTTLTCPNCGATATLHHSKWTSLWHEQLRRERLLLQAGISPKRSQD